MFDSRARLATAQTPDGPLLLAPLGATLCCLDTDGAIKWSRRFSGSHPGGQMPASPVFVKHGPAELILCGVDDTLYALTQGEIRDLSGRQTAENRVRPCFSRAVEDCLRMS